MNGTHKNLLKLIGLAALPALLGCHEMTVSTWLEVDGSGARHIEIVAEQDEGDDELTIEQYTALMNVTKERGWTHELRTQMASSGRKKLYHHFRRDTAIDELDGWAEQSGVVDVQGSDAESGFQNVRFRNAVEVSTGVAQSRRTITYRERFYWDGFVDALADFQLERLRDTLQKSYPKLEPESVGSILGVVRAGLWSAVEDGILSMGDFERSQRFRRLRNWTLGFCMDKIHEAYPGASDDRMDAFLHRVFVDRDADDDELFDERALGATLASVLEITVKLEMDGVVVETNADSRDGNVLVWTFKGEDAIAAPVELFARAEIGDTGGGGR